MILAKEIKEKMEKERQAYFVHSGRRDIEYEIQIFKEQNWMMDGGEEKSELYSCESTPFYGQIVRRIENLIGKSDVGDIKVSHDDTTIFILYHYKGKVTWPSESQSERGFAD